ncbi:MAG: glycosyl transferase, partial [Nitrososphaera sp.]
MYGPGTFLYVIFLVSAWITTLYSLNFYYLAYHSDKNRAHKMRVRSASAPAPSNLSSSSSSSSSASAGARLPHVTIQLPLYNEKYVARRLIDAVCKIDYPKSLLQIQVLDDSDDDTVDLISSIVNEYRLKGFDIVQLHRTDRSGYKAGALKEGMKSATGEYIAIFDADFIPPSNFIRHLLRYFDDPKMGFVQCKWGHINENYSTMTQAEALSLDIHFLVEQRAKSLSHIFLNFNGTAGIWRKGCIDDAGGWHTTTLVEDMDLSYRAQMKGWKCMFLDDFVVNAELPVQINAVKRQQFRWAKGSIQVALKLMVDVMLHKKVPLDSKLQSFIHMTRYIVNPLFLAQFLIFPMLLAMQYDLYQGSWAPLAVLGMYVALGPGGYLLVINKVWKDRWKGKARQFLYLNFFAAGLTVNNSVAVFDALFGRKNEFLRTPKFGITDRGQEWCNKEYVLPFTKTTLLEIFFAIYGVIGIFTAIFSKNALYSPLIAIPTIGFIYVAYLSIAHSQFGKKKRERGNAFPAAATTTASNAAGRALEHEDGKNDGRKPALGQKVLLPGIL